MNTVDGLNAAMRYNICLLKVNGCKRDACRNMFAHLTEMSYCLELETKCVDDYKKYLDVSRKSQ